MGLKRHLTTAEIVDQVVFAQHLFTDEVGVISNVVFMGMGEPFQNVESVISAADIMVHDRGLHFSSRKVTVSTSGLVPQLKRFLHESSCALAVSLNATTDEVRNWIMPINSRGDDQMAACGQLGKPGDMPVPLFRVPEQFQMSVNA